MKIGSWWEVQFWRDALWENMQTAFTRAYSFVSQFTKQPWLGKDNSRFLSLKVNISAVSFTSLQQHRTISYKRVKSQCFFLKAVWCSTDISTLGYHSFQRIHWLRKLRDESILAHFILAKKATKNSGKYYVPKTGNWVIWTNCDTLVSLPGNQKTRCQLFSLKKETTG